MKLILGLALDMRVLGQAVSAARDYRSGNSTVEDVRAALAGVHDVPEPPAVAVPTSETPVLVDASH